MEADRDPIPGVDYPRTFQEMEEQFRDDAACRDYIRRLRWPNGFVCPHCQEIGEPWIMSDGLLRCRICAPCPAKLAAKGGAERPRLAEDRPEAQGFLTAPSSGLPQFAERSRIARRFTPIR